jgi:ABC-type amino acid transport substrate-binding protein
MIGDPFDHDGQLHKVSVYGYEQAMTMVEGGHADGAVGSLLTLRRIMRRHASAGRFDQELVLAHVDLALQMNKNFASTPAAQKIDRAVAALRTNGEADRIIHAHFGMETE